MRHFLFTIQLGLLFFGCTSLHAQNSTKYSLDTLRSWDCTEAAGDLNKDGIGDLAIIAIPRDEAHIKRNEAGYEYNFNQPLLAIFWGKKDGTFVCWKQYDNVVPAREDEYHSVNPSIEITPQGVLRISLEHFSSAGSWGNLNETFVFRYQQGDFYLIGQDEDSMMRNTGEGEYTSINYLTLKKQYRTYNAFNSKVKPREKWSRIPKKPLKRLGTQKLGE